MPLSRQTRQAVRSRAGDCCEYCYLSADHAFIPYHADHIIAVKHGGTDQLDNLCWACFDCNAYKGDNVAALDPLDGKAARLFHPRLQEWGEHPLDE